jgi:hypothetical protein
MTKQSWSNRQKKGLKIDDRFDELVKTQPYNLQKIYDQYTSEKIESLEFEAVGKPNILFSYSGMEADNTFVMNQLANMESEEFVQTAEKMTRD